MKPFYENDLYSSIEIAFNNYNHHKDSLQQITPSGDTKKFSDSIFIKEGNVFSKVLLSNILYIESEHVYLNIYTSDKHYDVRTKLEEFVNNYPAANLIRVHRSYAINANNLESIGDASLIVAGKKVPMNQIYKQELLRKFNRLS